MIPVVTAEEMGQIDAASDAPLDQLIERAGAAVARAALAMVGGGYGRRVVVVAGKGSNGADGRAAAARLRRRGMRVVVIEAAEADRLPPSDLVIDAAYGTGGRTSYRAPDPAGAPVLAVDLPSGVDADTGEAGDDAVQAAATITFAALKPGLLLGPGAERAGAIEVADIGLDAATEARAFLVEDDDVLSRLPSRAHTAHKWTAVVYAVAGSPGMMGAALLCATAALRAGAGNVRLASPGVAAEDLPAGEVVARSLPADSWESAALADSERCTAMVMGPGLGLAESTGAAVRRLAAATPLPLVIDADGLTALGPAAQAAEVLRRRSAPTVLTPHEGELARLTGSRPGADRLAEVRALAAQLGAVVLLKGPTTVIAEPGGAVLLTATGSPRLATGGSGDVLAGVIGAFLSVGVEPLWAAAAGAHVHGAAAGLGPARGLVAGDLVTLVPGWLSEHLGA